MPPRRTRAAKKADEHQDAAEAATTAEPSASTSSASRTVEAENVAAIAPESTPSKAKAKGKSRAARHQPLLAEGPTPVPAAPTGDADADDDDATTSEAVAQPDPEATSTAAKPTMEDRHARLSALRAKMSASSRANRRDILSEQSRARSIASDLSSSSTSSRKLLKAEKLLQERDLRESGTDVERHRNLHYSLEDSETWDSKLEAKERRKDSGPGDFGDAAKRAYQRQLKTIKPDLAAYKKQTQQAGSSHLATPASLSLTRPDTRAHDELHYGTHQPNDDAVDRVITHLNAEKQKIKNRSRRRNDDGEEVNYINDSNRHFNKKLKRFYDKQTQEIRENLERGTAL
ncbi:splicing factor [Pseudozyma hubeiensis SY62]|uniref:Pre-mRNA-splicing factor SYF2 n=1 Tax=Pseudozyma hubeiensis (strain SY62) TaxID=1305764 RepID=R9P904_PSEHS|nr:splicing factor [Pseudozyma hubeiensis SY62]GAC97819.1 splicing factor [Pseudozyma hubeiensis SY62]